MQQALLFMATSQPNFLPQHSIVWSSCIEKSIKKMFMNYYALTSSCFHVMFSEGCSSGWAKPPPPPPKSRLRTQITLEMHMGAHLATSTSFESKTVGEVCRTLPPTPCRHHPPVTSVASATVGAEVFLTRTHW